MASFLSRSVWATRLVCIALFLVHGLGATSYTPYCNGDIYGKPVSIQCISILARFPVHDTAVRYFVEQQMRTAPPAANWDAFTDPRPPNQKQAIVQLPKWISQGQISRTAWRFANVQCP